MVLLFRMKHTKIINNTIKAEHALMLSAVGCRLSATHYIIYTYITVSTIQ